MILQIKKDNYNISIIFHGKRNKLIHEERQITMPYCLHNYIESYNYPTRSNMNQNQKP